MTDFVLEFTHAELMRSHRRERPPRKPLPRCTKKKQVKYLWKFLNRPVNLGPVLVGELKMRKALARGKAYAKSK